MSSRKSAVVINGETHYSIEGAAQLLSMTPKKLKATMIEMGLDWTNHRNSVRIWISARSIVDYQRRLQASANDAPTD